MSADINIHQRQAMQQWLAYTFPGSDVKETKQCGASILCVFHRSVDGLIGAVIQGDRGQERDLAIAMEDMIERHGPLTLMMVPEKFDALVRKYLPQPSSSTEKTLQHRTIRPISMPGEAGRPLPTYIHASLQPPRVMGMSVGLRQGAAAIPATAQTETESRKGEIQQELDATIS